MPAPPVADKRPHVIATHDDVREDPYFWLRERGSEDVLAYLSAENEYADTLMAPHEPFVEALYEEIKGRIPQDDEGLPQVGRCGWSYSWRIKDGDEYPVYFRTRDGVEQTMLDLNEVGENHDYVEMTVYACPPGTDIMWYTLDVSGSGEGQLLARNLRRQEDFKFEALLENDEFSRVVDFAVVEGYPDAIWFVTEDEQTKRADRLWFWRVKDDEPTLVAHEKDDRFCISISKSSDHRYLVIDVSSHTTDEVWIADASSVVPRVALLFPRRQGVELDVDHHGTHWLVQTNLSDEGSTHRNYELVAVPDSSALEDRRVLIPHREDVLLEGIEVFRDHLVVCESTEGVTSMFVYDLADGSVSNRRRIPFPEKLIECGPGANYIMDTHVVRVEYESLTTPSVTYDCDMRTMEMTELKRTEVLGGFDHEAYEVTRIYATAPDGTKVPVSLTRRKDTPLDGTAPCFLSGYGAYGLSYELYFAGSKVSLLDRGFVCAIAHVRGGSELGKPWHDAGRMEHKMNTFTDFIACAEHLVAEKISAPDKLCVQGRSAGGLLMGAVANMRPDLFKIVYAAVPFVDVVTTMLDDTVPLVVGEFEEWGNPAVREDYDRMMAYSPYDNVEAKEYPAMLIRTSINDGAVMYWEPAKWVAKLRATKTDDNPILFRCDMGSGHVGSSGRYDRYREVAQDLAFICSQVGITS